MKRGTETLTYQVFIAVIAAYVVIKCVEGIIASEREYRAQKKAYLQQRIDHEWRKAQFAQEAEAKAYAVYPKGAHSTFVPLPEDDQRFVELMRSGQVVKVTVNQGRCTVCDDMHYDGTPNCEGSTQ